MKRIAHASLTLAVAFSISVPAFSQEPNKPAESPQEAPAVAAAQGQPDADTPKAEEERVRCRSEFQLHSRIPQRICRTESQWAEIERQNREATNNTMRNRGSVAESGTIYGADGL